MIRETAGKYPQESYAVVVYAIQSEWIFLECKKKTWDMRLQDCKKRLWETFLLLLFFGKSKSLPPILVPLSTMLVNKSSLGLRKPVTSSNQIFQSLQR